MRTLYFCPVLSIYLFFPRLVSAVADWMSTNFDTWCGFSANLECMCEMCCTRLAENTTRKNDAKNRHLGTIAQLCWAISLQLRHVSTIGIILKQQYLPHVSSQYGELRPTNGWDLLASLGHPSKFKRVLRLGSVTVRHSSSERQPNFAELNRGRHLYSAGQPSRCTLAHISSFNWFAVVRSIVVFVFSCVLTDCILCLRLA